MRTTLYIIFMIALNISSAYAHRANIFARIEGKRILCECFYQDGKPIIDQPVTVTRSDNTIMTEGKTDTEGMFSFSPETYDDLIITVDAGLGHIAKTNISKEKLSWLKVETVAKKPSPVKTPAPNDSIAERTDQIDDERLRTIIEQAVGEKLNIIIDLIQKQQRSQSLITIIGGIGYIIGIFGLIMFFKSRKKP